MNLPDWICPECYEVNDGVLQRCTCGYEYRGNEATVKKEARTETVNAIADTDTDTDTDTAANTDIDRILALVVEDDSNKSWWKNLLALIASLALFFMAGIISWNITTLLALIISIFVHELGHLWAMKLTGHKNLQMLFIPFMGGIASGESEKEVAANNATIAIFGPLIGILSALISAFLFNLIKMDFFKTYAELTVILSVFNLLPIYPLDGGRFFNDLLLYRYSKVEMLFRVGAAGLFVFGAIKLSDYLFLFIGIIVLLPLKINMAITEITKAYIAQYGPKKRIEAGVVEFLRDKLIQHLPALERPRNKDKALASYIKIIMKKVEIQHATGRQIFMLIVLYMLVLLVLPLATVVLII